MANSIPAGTVTPHHRIQRLNTTTGEYEPVTDSETTEAPAAPFAIGDAVVLKGRVIEVQAHQGGATSVKVQMPNGAAYVRAEWLEPVDTTTPGYIASLEEQLAAKSATIDDLTAQVARLQARVAKGFPTAAKAGVTEGA